MLYPSFSQSTNDSNLDNFILNNPIVYPIAGAPISLVIAAYNPGVFRTDTLMLFITTMSTVITAIYPRGDVRFRRGERIDFAYKSLGLLVIDTSETAHGLTYFKVGTVAKGLGQFVEQYGYFYLGFEIREAGVGKIGMGRMYMRYAMRKS